MQIRALLGLALLLGAAVYSSSSACFQAVSDPPDPQVAADKEYYDRERFASVKPFLPRSGVIGYREDSPPRSDNWDGLPFAQYAVVPIVLSEDANGPWILVNGRPEARPVPVGGERPLTLLHDAGNGVYLFGPPAP
ncbi:MAG TPA: hypothetical protein VKA46_40400 [Gemmataceae bacterium]|nr:hypothetical protein [Gemmataceae bacterium]